MTDKELKRIAAQFRDGILEGKSSAAMCFAICAPLQSFLSCGGFETELIEADFEDTNHFWLRLPDGRILDPTADQFGLSPVYLGRLPTTYCDRIRKAQDDRKSVSQGVSRP